MNDDGLDDEGRDAGYEVFELGIADLAGRSKAPGNCTILLE
jgi:hypothetical protein